ncbi:MAG: alpha/beta hydrolase [Nanoarchaeota archaeon]
MVSLNEKNCIIVHGCSIYRKEKLARGKSLPNMNHWIPWIKNELETNGIVPYALLMPKDWKPNYNEWKKEFEKINITNDSILVGHSAGCTFLLHWLSEAKREVNKLILVSPR